MNNSLLIWSIITLVYAVVIYCVEMGSGVIGFMAANDASYICYGLWALCIFGALFIANQCRTQPDARKLHFRRVDDLIFISQVLGLLGTVVGLSLMFSELDLTAVDSSNQENITKLMASVVLGLGTAFYTTITGIVVSIMLWAYKFVIAYYGNGFLYVKVKK